MFRQIITPRDTQLLLQIPQEFVNKQVEVIAFTVDFEVSDMRKLATERHSPKERMLRLKKFIKANAIKLPPGYKFNREELYE